MWGNTREGVERLIAQTDAGLAKEVDAVNQHGSGYVQPSQPRCGLQPEPKPKPRMVP